MTSKTSDSERTSQNITQWNDYQNIRQWKDITKHYTVKWQYNIRQWKDITKYYTVKWLAQHQTVKGHHKILHSEMTSKTSHSERTSQNITVKWLAKHHTVKGHHKTLHSEMTSKTSHSERTSQNITQWNDQPNITQSKKDITTHYTVKWPAKHLTVKGHHKTLHSKMTKKHHTVKGYHTTSHREMTTKGNVTDILPWNGQKQSCC